MKKIPLGKNKFALVDDTDFNLIANKKWHIRGRYAVHSVYQYPKNPGTLSMHKLILNAPNSMVVDHINGDGLDNRRSNLRIVTQRQNALNRKPYANTKSGYKGVTLDSRTNLWQARITVNGKRLSLGARKNPREAAKLYIEAAMKFHGEFMHHTTRELVGML